MTNQAVAGAEAQMQRQDRAIRQYTLAHQHLKALLIEAVKSGSDIKLPRPGDRFVTLYPVSHYLTEPSLDAHRALLFKACGEAMQGRDPGDALRSYVDAIAADYADDYAEAMAEGEAA